MRKLILIVIVLWFASVLQGADAYRRYQFPAGIGLDSVRILLRADSLLVDSISNDSLSDFPETGLILIDDQRQWEIEYYRYWGGDPDPSFNSEVLYGSAGPFSPPSLPWANLCNVFIQYRRAGVPQKGARLYITNHNVSTDTTTSTVIGPIKESDPTDSLGIANIQVPRSFIFGDSLKSLYDISLKYGGRIVYSWSDYFVPNQDSVRLVIE